MKAEIKIPFERFMCVWIRLNKDNPSKDFPQNT